MAYFVKSSAGKPMKNRPREKRERRERESVGVERRRVSLRRVRACCRVRELSGRLSDGRIPYFSRHARCAQFSHCGRLVLYHQAIGELDMGKPISGIGKQSNLDKWANYAKKNSYGE